MLAYSKVRLCNNTTNHEPMEVADSSPIDMSKEFVPDVAMMELEVINAIHVE